MGFTIAHITDPHLSPAPLPGLADFRLKRFMGYRQLEARARERLNDMGVLARLVEDLRRSAPTHVAVTGDLVNIGMPSEFRRAALWMRTLGDPHDVSFVPGNHDAYVRASMPMLNATFEPWTTGDSGVSGFPFLRVRGEVAIIGLSSGVPTAPLMATGRLGRKQLQAFAALLDETGARGLARVVLIHHPPLARGAPPFRGLTDAAAFERVIEEHGAEAILHGHTHKQLVRSLPSRAARTIGGTVPVLGAPSPRPPPTTRAPAPPTISCGWNATRRSGGSAPACGGSRSTARAIGEREALAV